MVRAITACSAALVCLASALLAASSARAAPYPPTQPCAVTAWRYGPLAADGSAEYSVTGTGLGPSQPVRLLLASRTVLGQTTTDPAGGFAAHVRAPREAAGGTPITASTAQQTCNSGPPVANPAPSAGATAPSSGPPSGRLSGGGGQTTGGAGAIAPGAATPGSPTTGATTSALPSGSTSLGAPVTGGPSGRPSAPAPRAEPGITHAISAYLGLVIAAVLLVLGTLAVLLLTRRAGH